MNKKNSNDYYVLLGSNIRKIRKKSGYNQEDLANVTGVTYQQIQKYESGSSRVPINVLMGMADFLKVPLSEFLSFKSSMKAHAPVFHTDKYPEDIDRLLEAWRKIKSQRVKEDFLNLIEGISESQIQTLPETKKNRTR